MCVKDMSSRQQLRKCKSNLWDVSLCPILVHAFIAPPVAER